MYELGRGQLWFLHQDDFDVYTALVAGLVSQQLAISVARDGAGCFLA